MALSDSQLIEKARTGDSEAFGVLWQRHASAAQWAAERLVPLSDSEDVVQESFARLFSELQDSLKGTVTGPFRQYVYVMVRHVAESSVIHAESPLTAARSLVLDDSFTDTFVEHALVNQAYNSLSPQWRSILWYTEVEELTPVEIAPLLGISANAVSALAYRAREGLRASWLRAHITTSASDPACEWTVERLGMYARGTLSARHTAKIHEHLAACENCTVLLAEVTTAADQLRASALTAILGFSVVLIKPASAATTAQAFSSLATDSPLSAGAAHLGGAGTRSLTGFMGTGTVPFVGTMAASIALIAAGIVVFQTQEPSTLLASGTYSSSSSETPVTSTQVPTGFFGQTAQFVASSKNVQFNQVKPPNTPQHQSGGNSDQQLGIPLSPQNPASQGADSQSDSRLPGTPDNTPNSTPSNTDPSTPQGTPSSEPSTPSGTPDGPNTPERPSVPEIPTGTPTGTPTSTPTSTPTDTPTSTPTSTPSDNPAAAEPEYVPVFFAERINLSDPRRVTFGGTGPFYGAVSIQDEAGTVVGSVVVGGDSRWSITVADTYTAAGRTSMTYRLFISENGGPAQLGATLTASGLG